MTFDNNFLDDKDFVDALNRGCEVEFLYQGKKYSVTHTGEGISIVEFYNEDSERTYADAEKALEHRFGEKTLKQIIPEMRIIDRSF